MFIRQVYYVILGMYRQKDSRKKIEKKQLKYINRFLKDASTNVPFYFKNSYKKELNSLEELQYLPIISKTELRKNGIKQFQNIYLKDDFLSFKTSGSTGEPIEIIHDKKCYDYHTAIGVRRVLATGIYNPFFYLSHIRPMELKKRRFERLGLFRRDVIPASSSIGKIKKELLLKKPDGIVGYPVYFRDLIAASTQEELAQIRTNLKIIFTESEKLTESHRGFIQKRLGVEIFDDYSAYETLSITFECSEHKHHVVEDRIIVEIVDDDGKKVEDGFEGNIIVTSFFEKAMPLVRYSIGDRGILKSDSCSCGRTFKTLQLTDGRIEDCLILQSGEKIYSPTVLHLAAQLTDVREVYIHQNSCHVITIYYVPLHESVDHNKIEAFIRIYFSDYVKNYYELEIVASDFIPKNNGGKARLIYSEINHKENEDY